ncbi:MAG: helix-turn-helix domain-containing protein [bacterium]|nr:helix-turn-helix domain-containing protein [bacterium]
MLSKNELHQNLSGSLKELGLSDSEANLYIISLSIGPASIATLAKHLSISRPNVYKVIMELEKHGLAKYSENKRWGRTFIVEPPAVLVHKVREKRDSLGKMDGFLTSLMPDLNALYHQGETATKIKILEGKDWVRYWMEMMEQNGKEELIYFGSIDDFIGYIGWDGLAELTRERMRKGVVLKTLLLPGEKTREIMKRPAEEIRDIRLLDGASPFVTSFQIFLGKVLIWQPKAPLAVLIEDQYIVEMLRSMFNLLWEKSGNTNS